MDNIKELKNTSRYISLLLRHKPEKENLVLDKNGYVDVDELLKVLNIKFYELEWIVFNNDKKRFSFNENKTKIKANQGHSVEVDLKLKRILPPQFLFHSTSSVNAENIFISGIKKMTRHHVHLTRDRIVAHTVGLRYARHQGNLWLIAIDAKKMNEDGFEFFKSENDVYLVDHVPSKFFIKDSSVYSEGICHSHKFELFEKYSKHIK